MAFVTLINICTQKEGTFDKYVIASTLRNMVVELSNNKIEAAKVQNVRWNTWLGGNSSPQSLLQRVMLKTNKPCVSLGSCEGLT